MRAITPSPEGAASPLRVTEHPEPVIGADDLLIEIHATALNRADLLQRAGTYPPPPGAPKIMGLECAGTVVGWGEGVRGWARGERVMALLPGGGYAERVAVHHGSVMRVPERLSWAEAAAIPEAWLTAYSNLIEIGRLREGERALIHAGASGVGSAAIQLARWRGATVFATASAGKLDALRALGANHAIDYRAGPFLDAIHAETEGGVDVIVDFIGAPYLEQNLQALALWGRLILVGLMGGRLAEINLGVVLSKKLTVAGSTLRDRSLGEKSRLVGAFAEHVLPAIADGTLRPVLDDRRFPLEAADAAHAYMQSNRNVGKIVLEVRQA